MNSSLDGNGVEVDVNSGGKLDELRREFFADEDLIASRLKELTKKVRQFCTVDKRGNVHVVPSVTGAKNQLLVVLAARAVAARLNSDITEDASVAEIAEATGLANDVISARCGELVKARVVVSSRRGTFRIQQDRIERFLDTLPVA